MPDHTAEHEHERECECHAKSWAASRVLWFNGAVAALAAAEGSLGLLRPLLGEHAFPALTFIVVTGNCILRALTSSPIAFSARRDRGAADHGADDGRDHDDEART